MDKKWNEKTTLEKTMDIISAVAFFVWLAFEALDRSYKLPYAEFVSCIAICVVCICEAVSFWNIKRVFSYVAIIGAVLLAVVVVLKIMLLA